MFLKISVLKKLSHQNWNFEKSGTKTVWDLVFDISKRHFL